MIVTRFNLLGADGKFKHVTFEGKHDEPFEFIKTTEYSDYKVVGHDILDLGLFKSDTINTIIFNTMCKWFGMGIRAKTEDKISELKPTKEMLNNLEIRN
jgi:hypothetical protein